MVHSGFHFPIGGLRLIGRWRGFLLDVYVQANLPWWLVATGPLLLGLTILAIIFIQLLRSAGCPPQQRSEEISE
jgi:F0F1-type ATP synthase assembly protein I